MFLRLTRQAAAAALLFETLSCALPAAGQHPPPMSRGALPASAELLQSLPETTAFRAVMRHEGRIGSPANLLEKRLPIVWLPTQPPRPEELQLDRQRSSACLG